MIRSIVRCASPPRPGCMRSPPSLTSASRCSAFSAFRLSNSSERLGVDLPGQRLHVRRQRRRLGLGRGVELADLARRGPGIGRRSGFKHPAAPGFRGLCGPRRRARYGDALLAPSGLRGLQRRAPGQEPQRRRAGMHPGMQDAERGHGRQLLAHVEVVGVTGAERQGARPWPRTGCSPPPSGRTRCGAPCTSLPTRLIPPVDVRRPGGAGLAERSPVAIVSPIPLAPGRRWSDRSPRPAPCRRGWPARSAARAGRSAPATAGGAPTRLSCCATSSVTGWS